MSDDLVRMLRQQPNYYAHLAADEIERLRAEISRLSGKAVIPQAAFDAFWSAYPCKKAKPAAQKAFQKVAGEFNAIMSGLEQYKLHKPDYADWLHPSTFLNQRRWEDEYDAPATGRTYNTQKDGIALLLQEAKRREADVEQGEIAGNVVRLLPRPDVERRSDKIEDRDVFDCAGALF